MVLSLPCCSTVYCGCRVSFNHLALCTAICTAAFSCIFVAKSSEMGQCKDVVEAMGL